MILLKEAKQRGLKYYFTGKPCRNGHVSQRVVKNRSCTTCCLEKTRLWREGNFEHVKIYSSNYHKANPLIKTVSEQKRRALKIRSEGSFNRQDIVSLLAAQNNCCAVCNIDFNQTGYHIDHMIPLSRGGSNDVTNLQLLCPYDNVKKNTLTNQEYLDRIRA